MEWWQRPLNWGSNLTGVQKTVYNADRENARVAYQNVINQYGGNDQYRRSFLERDFSSNFNDFLNHSMQNPGQENYYTDWLQQSAPRLAQQFMMQPSVQRGARPGGFSGLSGRQQW